MRVELVVAPRAVGGSRRAPVRAAPYPEASPALARAEIRETAAFRAAVPFIRFPPTPKRRAVPPTTRRAPEGWSCPDEFRYRAASGPSRGDQAGRRLRSSAGTGRSSPGGRADSSAPTAPGEGGRPPEPQKPRRRKAVRS